MIAAALAIVFFLPLSFIYGRYRARNIKAEGGTLKSQLSSLIPLPALFLTCAVIAVIYEREQSAAAMLELRGGAAPVSALATGHAASDFAIRVARWIGEAELILFMVAIPFILGAAISAVLLVLDARGTISLAAPVQRQDDVTTQRQCLAATRQSETKRDSGHDV